MNLITPQGGLLFWMVLIFGVVLFILAKWGFPVITSAIDKRSSHIAESLRKAEEIEQRLSEIELEHKQMIESAKKEQAHILHEASAAREQLLLQSREEASAQTERMIEKARLQIEADRKTALADMRRQVAMLSVEVAEKVIRTKLASTEEQNLLIDNMLNELSGKTDTLS